MEGSSAGRLALQTALPEIERIAGLPAASDDDKRALRSAQPGPS